MTVRPSVNRLVGRLVGDVFAFRRSRSDLWPCIRPCYIQVFSSSLLYFVLLFSYVLCPQGWRLKTTGPSCGTQTHVNRPIDKIKVLLLVFCPFKVCCLSVYSLSLYKKKKFFFICHQLMSFCTSFQFRYFYIALSHPLRPPLCCHAFPAFPTFPTFPAFPAFPAFPLLIARL